MKQVGIKQARQQLPDLIDRVEAGEEIVITRQGKAVAQLVSAPKMLKPLPSLAEFRRGLGQIGTSSVQILREERDAQLILGLLLYAVAGVPSNKALAS